MSASLRLLRKKQYGIHPPPIKVRTTFPVGIMATRTFARQQNEGETNVAFSAGRRTRHVRGTHSPPDDNSFEEIHTHTRTWYSESVFQTNVVKGYTFFVV